jgi:SAM-dependent methyltransferase
MLERHADALEARFTDPRQQAMLRDYLADIEFPEGARVLEIGCGTGAVTRRLAQWPNVAHATGVDPSKVFVSRARKLAQDIRNLSFEEGDGRRLPFDEETFDVVVVHTVICHVPQPEQLIAEALRVMRPHGWLAVFDGDYATSTVATGDCDPLQACIDVLPVHDLSLVRRLPALLEACGFKALRMRSHGYVEASEGGYMLTWVDRGADALVRIGRIGIDLAEALRMEAKRRSASRSWFGHISFFSVLGRKPA